MPERALPLHEPTPEILLGRQRIVRSTAQRDIRWLVLAAARKWQQMMQLQTMRFAATLSR